MTTQTDPTPLLPFSNGTYPVDTLVLSNNSLIEGNVRPASGYQPFSAVNDTLNGYVYIGDYNAITVFDPTTESIVTTIADSGDPQALAFDSGNGKIFAADDNANRVSVVNGSTNTIQATVAVGTAPQAVAVDPYNGNVYVGCALSDSVSVINGSNDTLIANLSVGSLPDYLTVDDGNGEVFVGNAGGTNVSIISPTNETVFTSISTGGAPEAETYDPATGAVYVPVGSKVEVVNGTTNKVVTSFGTGSGPRAPTIDPATGELYIPCFSSSNITVYSPSKAKVVANIALFTRPEFMVYDPINRDLYVTEQPPAITPPHFQVVATSNSTVIKNIPGGEYLFCLFVAGTSGMVFVADYGLDVIEVISPTTNSLVKTLPLSYYPVQVAADPANGELYVGDERTSQVTAISDKTGRVVGSWQIGTGPSEVAYDSANGDIYVADDGSSTLTAISGRTNTVVATIRTGGEPEALAVDPVNGYIYVANTNSNNLTVVNGSTNRLVATVGLGANSNPWELTVDTKSGNVFAGIGQFGVAVVSGTTNRILTNISVGPANTQGTWGDGDAPLGMAYDPLSDDIYVVGFYFDNLTVISGSNNSVVAVDRVGSSPEWVSVGANGEYVYVSNTNSANVSVVNASTNKVTGAIPAGSGPGPVLDYPARGYLYVANSGSANVTLVNSSGHRVVASVPVGGGADSFAVGPTSGDVWVANGGQGTMSILAPATYVVKFNETGLPNGTGWAATFDGMTAASNGSHVVFDVPNGTGYDFSIPGVDGFTWSPQSGTLNISGRDVTVNITFLAAPDHHLLTFSEVGLPGDATWNVALNGSTPEVSSGSTIGFSLRNGSGYTYRVGDDAGFAPIPALGTVNLSGTPVTVNITFAQLFAVTFNETGLPTGKNWTVDLNDSAGSSSTSTISFSEPNGTYAWFLTPIAGFTTSWSGQVTVNGSDARVLVRFVQVTYRIDFAESGLAAGTVWNLSIDSVGYGTNSTTILVEEPNGTFPWAVVPISGYVTNWSGSISVSGFPESVNLSFTRVNYTLTFQESGLPLGSDWTVTIGSTARSSTSAYIEFVEPNGTFNWDIGSIAGYSTAWSGVAVIQGGPGTVNVSFDRVNYNLTIEEAGLPTGTVWSVSLNGSSVSTAATAVTFSVPNGTYDWSIQPIPGFYTTWTGSVVVDNASRTLPANFTRTTYLVSFDETGLPAGVSWSVTLGGNQASGTGPSLTFEVPNGTFAFTIAPVPGWQANRTNGTLSVMGGSLSVTVPWVPFTYSVTFAETGLPSGTGWWVNVSGETPGESNTSTISIGLPNGSYQYSLSTTYKEVVGALGSFVVLGAPVVVSVQFALVTYNVTFTESGLPKGTTWWVNLSNEPSLQGEGPSLSIELSNGSYDYTVATIDKIFEARGGVVEVQGEGPTVPTAFSPVTFDVTFREFGLPPGTEWSVVLGGVTESGSGNVSFSGLRNGTYPFTVLPVSSYDAATTGGNLIVNGSSQTLTIVFTGSPAGTGSGASPSNVLIVLAAVLAATVVGTILLWRRRRTSGVSQAPAGSPEPVAPEAADEDPPTGS